MKTPQSYPESIPDPGRQGGDTIATATIIPTIPYEDVGTTYHIVIAEHVPCVIDCPAGGFPEGEPPLVDGYVDNHNGGCNTDPGFPFQNLEGDQAGECTLCGVSGWYWSDGDQYRDTDWYVLRMGWGEAIEVTADAEVATAIYELGPQDCSFVGIIQQTIAGPCTEASLSMSGYTIGDFVWFWVGPMVFSPPAGGDSMYDYVGCLEGSLQLISDLVRVTLA